MSEHQPTNIELARLLEPWFPLFGMVGGAALRDHLAAVPIMGLPRKTERANDLHRTMRTHLRRVCDMAEPLLSLVEEPEGDGLDYLVCRMDPAAPFAVRWGRYHNLTIRRNRTQRTREMQEQGNLFGIEADEDVDVARLPMVTLGFTIEDDFTEVGRPCWWIGRLVLLRERSETSEYITEVHVYGQPDNPNSHDEVLAPIVAAREDEGAAWQQMIEQIRNLA